MELAHLPLDQLHSPSAYVKSAQLELTPLYYRRLLVEIEFCFSRQQSKPILRLTENAHSVLILSARKTGALDGKKGKKRMFLLFSQNCSYKYGRNQ